MKQMARRTYPWATPELQPGVTAAVIISALFMLAFGIWAFFAPVSFADFVAFPYNGHLLHDVGAFQIGIGATVLLALLWADSIVVVLAGYVVGSSFHLASHIIDRHIGGHGYDPLVLGFLIVMGLAGMYARAERTLPGAHIKVLVRKWECVGDRIPGTDRHELTDGRDVHETLFQSATDAARMLSRKEISSRELTEMLLARIDKVNPTLNAVVELRREPALQEAVAADEATARGDTAGPLHGVPMTIKDSFNVAEMHTTWGNRAFKDFVADSDATVVRRLERAGAIIVGKTNVAFMLGDFGQTANELYGVTNNPWDTTRTPGGSSGGAAAALSAGMTFLEYGSDLVGSIRVPASFCGVYGLKPSAGIVPLTGFQSPGPPPPPSDMMYMSAVGPLGRFPPDLRTVLSVTGGPENQAAKAYSWTLPPSRHTRLEDFRVGVVLDHEHAPVSSEVAAPLSNAVDALARAGATVVEGWPDGVDPVQHYESFGFHVQAFFAFQQPGEDFAKLSEFIDHENRRMAARAAWNRYFNDIVDVFLCPVNFTPAFPHDTRPFEQRTITTPEGERPYTDQAFWVSHASLPGLPAVAAPIGRPPGGLPVGAQIVGPLYEDDTAITFAELLGDVIGGYEPPPL